MRFEQGLRAPRVHTDRDTKTLDDALPYIGTATGPLGFGSVRRGDAVLLPELPRAVAGTYGGHVAESGGDRRWKSISGAPRHRRDIIYNLTHWLIRHRRLLAACAPPPKSAHHRFLADRDKAPRSVGRR